MKEGRSLTDLAAEIQRRAENRQDYLADTRQIQINGDSLLLPLLDKPLTITEHTHGQIAEYAGIPKAYYDKLRKEQPGLFKNNVETWLKSFQETRLVRGLDGRARAFMSNRYRPVDNEDVFTAALEAFSDVTGLQLVSSEVTDNRLYLKALFPRKELINPQVGDEIQAGVIVSNGEIGNGSISVRVMSYKLWCKNGAAGEHLMRQSHVGKQLTANDGIVYRDETIAADDKALLMKLTDMIKSVPGAPFDKLLSDTRRLAGLPEVDKPIQAVEALAKKLSFNEDRKNAVLERFLKASKQTPFEMVQAVTNVANTVDSYDDASELEAIGGKLTMMPANEWNEILKAA